MRNLETLPNIPSGSTMVTLWCTLGNHNWERISQRGRRPFACPDCAYKAALEAEDNKSPETDEQRSTRLASAREIKAQRAQERAQEAREHEQEQRQRVIQQLPSISERWNRAFTVALRENTDEAWRHAEQLMTGYVSTKTALAKR